MSHIVADVVHVYSLCSCTAIMNSLESSCIPVGAVIGFEELMYNSSEADGLVEVVVILMEGELARPIEVTITTADDTATG